MIGLISFNLDTCIRKILNKILAINETVYLEFIFRIVIDWCFLTGYAPIDFTINGGIANILYDSSNTDQLTLVSVIISDWY
jgi:hypothetical protein